MTITNHFCFKTEKPDYTRLSITEFELPIKVALNKKDNTTCRTWSIVVNYLKSQVKNLLLLNVFSEDSKTFMWSLP